MISPEEMHDIYNAYKDQNGQPTADFYTKDENFVKDMPGVVLGEDKIVCRGSCRQATIGGTTCWGIGKTPSGSWIYKCEH